MSPVDGPTPPANLPAEWQPAALDAAAAAAFLGRLATPAAFARRYGPPAQCTLWCDALGRSRLAVVEYPGGARLELRRANGRHPGSWQAKIVAAPAGAAA